MMLLSVFIVVLTGCGGSRGGDTGSGQQGMFRQPHPTFTPTAAVGTNQDDPSSLPATDNAGMTQEQPMAAAPALASYEVPRAVVNAPLVNVRAGPSTDNEIVATVERGAEYEIVGRSDDDEWWSVCCQDDLIVWISREFVDTDGSVDSVPVGGTRSLASEAAQPVPAGLGGNADEADFQLIAEEQFPESNLVRVYLYVYDGTNALAGYTLSILKDGREIPVTAQSFGGQPAFTWPFQDARQRYQNLKIELPDEPAAGAWTLQLIDPQGRPAGPPAEFSLAANDAQQELYVRYERGQ